MALFFYIWFLKILEYINFIVSLCTHLLVTENGKKNNTWKISFNTIQIFESQKIKLLCSCKLPNVFFPQVTLLQILDTGLHFTDFSLLRHMGTLRTYWCFFGSNQRVELKYIEVIQIHSNYTDPLWITGITAERKRYMKKNT